MVGKYAELHGVDFTGNVNAERLWLRSDCGVSGGGLERGLELMHLFLKQCINEVRPPTTFSLVANGEVG